jgi:phytoene synthase
LNEEPGTGAEGRRSADDARVTRRLLREGSKSFHAASLLLPRGVRSDAGAVYAWCRVADHAVDRSDDPARSLEEVRAGLERLYTGRARGPVERAFGETVFRKRIPRELPDAMVEGFEWDVAGRRYGTRAQVFDYCVRVGSTVGAMMTLVMERRDAATLAAACRLGVAMQLTNIARDVGEDARAGRVYLPIDALEEAGLDVDSWLAAPEPCERIRGVVRSLLDQADALYGAAWPGIRRLPAHCRPAIRAAALIYARIGRGIRRADCDSVTRRAWTGKAEKGALVARAIFSGGASWPGAGPGGGAEVVSLADERAAFLVAAVTGGTSGDVSEDAAAAAPGSGAR